jgi:hypothetical protein
MKNIFYAAIILVALSSCTKSQFVTVKSDAPASGFSTYFFENDSMKVSYTFKGYNCPVNVQVYNKLSVPLYIQWTKSALIIDGKTVPFWKDESSFSSGTYTTEIDWGGVSSSHSNTHGTIKRPESVSFIAPQSSVTNSRLYLKEKFFKVASHPKAKKSKKKIFLLDGPITANHYEFKKEDSPFQFKTYLTISTEQDGSNPTHITNSFWVAEVLQSGNIGNSYPLQDNEFRLVKATGFGTVVGGTVLIGTAVFLGVVAATE